MSLIEIAKAEINTCETPVNKTKYGKWYGLNGQPWCAIFVSWCFAQVGLSKSVAAQTPKGFASCDAGMKWFVKKNKIVPVGQAKPGDIVFFQFDEDALADHVGIVVGNNPITKNLVCIEGNTSSGGAGSQSNGDGVYKRKRSYSLVMAVARP
jgi:cell wall-associated NlpC family hydrolase